MLVFLALNGIEEEESTLSDASTVFKVSSFLSFFVSYVLVLCLLEKI